MKRTSSKPRKQSSNSDSSFLWANMKRTNFLEKKDRAFQRVINGYNENEVSHLFDVSINERYPSTIFKNHEVIAANLIVCNNSFPYVFDKIFWKPCLVDLNQPVKEGDKVVVFTKFTDDGQYAGKMGILVASTRDAIILLIPDVSNGKKGNYVHIPNNEYVTIGVVTGYFDYHSLKKEK